MIVVPGDREDINEHSVAEINYSPLHALSERAIDVPQPPRTRLDSIAAHGERPSAEYPIRLSCRHRCPDASGHGCEREPVVAVRLAPIREDRRERVNTGVRAAHSRARFGGGESSIRDATEESTASWGEVHPVRGSIGLPNNQGIGQPAGGPRRARPDSRDEHHRCNRGNETVNCGAHRRSRFFTSSSVAIAVASTAPERRRRERPASRRAFRRRYRR